MVAAHDCHNLVHEPRIILRAKSLNIKKDESKLKCCLVLNNAIYIWLVFLLGTIFRGFTEQNQRHTLCSVQLILTDK